MILEFITGQKYSRTDLKIKIIMASNKVAKSLEGLDSTTVIRFKLEKSIQVKPILLGKILTNTN